MDDQEDRQEVKKEENKKTIKVVIISVFCTLLFVAILLLVVLFGLKKCTRESNNSSNNSYAERFDNKKLDSVFKSVVSNQRKINAGEEIVPKEVVAVTYSLSNDNSKFNLSITMTTVDDKMFFYEATNCGYKSSVTGYDDFISYLLSEDEDQNLVFMYDGVVTLDKEDIVTSDVVNINKPNPHFKISKNTSEVRHISGYYSEDNNYYIYSRLEYSDNDNPLGDNKGTLIDDSSLLYGYYLRLSGVITD